MRKSLFAVGMVSAVVFLVMAISGTPLTGGVAQAQQISRVDARNMTCGHLQSVIRARGAAIVRSTSLYSNRLLWERYVSDRRFCFANEITRYRDVQTVDNRFCSVKLCTERNRFKRFRN